ncbi:MAG: hypothetical protein R3E97_00615 [Candidatus Eisenbacteria bacterium]
MLRTSLHKARGGVGPWARALAAGLTLSAALVSTGAASTTLQLDLDGLVRYADCVVQGTVVSVWSDWNAEGTQIYTDVVLDVSRSEGECVDAGAITRTVRMLGGVVDDIAMVVDGAPEMTAGEEVVLFLYEDSELLVPIVALERGKFTVSREGSQTQITNVLVGSFDRDTFWNTVTEIQEGR